MIDVNNTPVRTSKNFKINSIEIDEKIIPENINAFNNLKIENENKNVICKVLEDNNKEKIDVNLKYGLGNVFLNQINEKTNKIIKVDINGKTNENVKLDFLFNKDNNILVDYIEINLNEKINASLTICFEKEDNINTYHNGIIKLNAKKDSKINLTIVNLLNNKDYNFYSIENNIEENAFVNYTIVDLGSKTSVINYYSNIIGDLGENKLNSIYLGKDEDVLDINYIAELYGKKSKIDMKVEGALKDKAIKHFKGTIDFKKGAKKAIGDEEESCMLLSNEAKSIALPMLLCSEEDVEGSHATSAGKIDNKELFYVLSRGFTLKEAQKLLVKAKFNSILQSIKDEELKNRIIEEIDMRLD